MEKEFSQQIHKILKYSREEALRLKNDFISTEHLLLGFLKNNEKNMVYEVLKRLQCDPVDLRHKIEQTVKPLPFIVILDDVPLTKRAENVLKRAWVEANRTNALSISSEHLFLALLQEQDGLAAKILNVFDVTYDKARKELESLSVNNTVVKKNTNISAAIKQFGRDLTTLARKKSLDPVIGRDKEIERIIRILSRKKKNNPLIIGEPGVGKTAVVEGLAERIVEKRVPLNLINAQIFSLDLTSLVAGTSLRGKFEERLKLLLKNLLNLNNAILFIDEVHNIVGAGSNDNSMDISNMIKPLLAEGKLSVIGATTLNDYRKYIEKDKALARRFQNVLIESPNFNDTLKILKGVKAKYEEFHQVVYSTKTLKAAIKLSEQYITDRFLPDKAIDLLDEAGALTHLLNLENKKIHNDTIEKEANVKISREKILPIPEEVSDYQDLNNILSLQKRFKPEVTEHQIARILQSITGIPTSRLNRSEAEKLINLEDRLKKVIVGQDEAIGVITNSLKRARVGLKDPNKPIGSFIFVGPSGVGKTKLAQELAEELFADKNTFFRIDMSEFMEKFSLSRLIGAPPGYVGYEKGGDLTENVRRYPYSVVLFDKIDKAHPDVLNILLQLLDDGTLTDGIGRKINFRNTIIIMTINHEIKSAEKIGFINDANKNNSSGNFINKLLLPELLNRIDEIVEFTSLSEKDILKIMKIELTSITKRLLENDIKMSVSAQTQKFILENQLHKSNNGRQIKTIIRNLVEEPVARKIIEGKIKSGDHIIIKEVEKILDISVN